VSRFSTNVRSGVKFSLSTTKSFSAVTRARSKSHPTPNTECVTILYKYQISEVKSSQTHFWAPPCISRQWLVRVVNRTLLLIRGVSRFSTHMGSVSQVLTDALLSTTESLSAVNCARSNSHTTPNTRCVTILCKCEISNLNPHTFAGTCEYHWVFLDSDSST
jgi:hypothetical protein